MSASGPKDFDESFAQILSRTRQNIDRVNQTFTSSLYHSSSRLSQSQSGNPNSLSSSIGGGGGSGAGYYPASATASPVPSSRDLYANYSSHMGRSGSPPNVPSVRFLTAGESKFDGGYNNNNNNNNPTSSRGDGSKQITIDAMFFEDIRQRLYNIENRSRTEDTIQSKHVSDLEKQQDILFKQAEDYKSDIRELQRQVVHLTSSLRTQSQLLDNFQEEADMKRNSITRLESWYRETESWKSLVDTSIANSNKTAKALESDIKSSIFHNGNKDNVNAFMDRIDILTQQRISASNSVVYDRIDAQVRSLERSIASIRVQGNISPDISDAQVKEVLAQSYPMEVVVKGLISKEMRSLEDSIEGKLEARLQSALFNRFYEKEGEFKYQIQLLIKSISDELGIETVIGEGDSTSISSSSRNPKSGGTSSSSSSSSPGLSVKSVIDKRRVAEGSVELLTQRVTDLARDLSTVSLNVEELQTGVRGDLSLLERTISEKALLSKHWNEENSNSIDKFGQSLKEVESKLQDSVAKTREFFLGHVHDSINSHKDEIAGLDKRVTIGELRLEDMMKRTNQPIDTTNIDSMIASSSACKRLESSVHRIDLLTEEIRKVDLSILTMESQNVKLSDFYSLKDRVNLHDLSLKHVEDIDVTVKQNGQAIRSLQLDVQQNQKDFTRFVSEQYTSTTNSVKEKLADAEANYLSTSHKIDVINHETQLINARMSKVENEIPGIEVLIKRANEENMRKSDFTSFHIKLTSDIAGLTSNNERLTLRVHDFSSELAKSSSSMATQMASNTSLISKESASLSHKFDMMKLFVDDKCTSLHGEVSTLEQRVKNNYELLDNKLENYRTLQSTTFVPSTSVIAGSSNNNNDSNNKNSKDSSNISISTNVYHNNEESNKDINITSRSSPGKWGSSGCNDEDSDNLSVSKRSIELFSNIDATNESATNESASAAIEDDSSDDPAFITSELSDSFNNNNSSNNNNYNDNDDNSNYYNNNDVNNDYVANASSANDSDIVEEFEVASSEEDDEDRLDSITPSLKAGSSPQASASSPSSPFVSDFNDHNNSNSSISYTNASSSNIETPQAPPRSSLDNTPGSTGSAGVSRSEAFKAKFAAKSSRHNSWDDSSRSNSRNNSITSTPAAVAEDDAYGVDSIDVRPFSDSLVKVFSSLDSDDLNIDTTETIATTSTSSAATYNISPTNSPTSSNNYNKNNNNNSSRLDQSEDIYNIDLSDSPSNRMSKMDENSPTGKKIKSPSSSWAKALATSLGDSTHSSFSSSASSLSPVSSSVDSTSSPRSSDYIASTTASKRLNKTINSEELEAVESHGVVERNIKVFEKKVDLPPPSTSETYASIASSANAAANDKASRAEVFKAKFSKKK